MAVKRLNLELALFRNKNGELGCVVYQCTHRGAALSIGKFANRIIEHQDKRVVITQKPKESSLKLGEKLVMGDGPIVMYRKIRDEMKNNPL